MFVLLLVLLTSSCGGAQIPLADTMDGLATLLVNQSNPYCNFERRNGPVCNMTGTDATLIVPAAFNMPDALELEIYNASGVVLYPVCLPWVQVWSLRGLTTPRAPQDNDSPSKFCRTWLRAYNSRLDSLTSGLLDVTLVESSVGVVNLHDMRDFMAISSNVTMIEHLDWEGYSGLLVSTRIKEIISLKCSDDMSMINVTIGRINSNGFIFGGDELVVNMTNFQHLMKNALQIRTGRAKLTDTFFKQVAKYGISVLPGAKFILQNVTIEHCTEPCIVVPYEASLQLINVTVDGKELTKTSSAVLYSEYDESTAVAKGLNEYTQCSTLEGKIVCDFAGFTEPVFVVSTTNYSTNNVVISSAKSLHIVNACNLNMSVSHSTVRYTRSKLNYNGEPNKECLAPPTLTATNSSFQMIIAKKIQSLKLINSNVNEVQVDSIIDLDVRNKTKIIFFSATVTGNTVLENSSVTFLNTNLKGGLQAYNVTFPRIINLTIGEIEGNSTISHSKIGFMHHELMIHGSLIMKNVVFGWLRLFPINLTESATLYIDDVNFIPRTGAPAIWVDRREQVVWVNASQADDRLVHVRYKVIQGNMTMAGPGQPDCAPAPSLFSHLMSSSADYTCDYTGKKSGQHVSIMRSGASMQILRIIGATYVDLTNSCSLMVIMRHVVSANMTAEFEHCEYSLRDYGSTIDNIINQPTSLILSHSKVGSIRTDSVSKAITFIDTTIETLNTSAELAILLNTNITKSMDMFNIIQDGTIGDSYIESISHANLSSFTISYSEIHTVHSGGIYITNKLIINDVTIHVLHKNAIIIGEEGRLFMTNVVIEYGWAESFNHRAGEIKMFNVTLNGVLVEDINSIQTITEPHVVNIPTTYNPEPKSPVSKTEVSKLTTPNTLSSTIIASTAEENDAKNAAVSSSSSDTGKQAWKRWAAAGAGIFMGLSIIVVTMSVVIAIRSHRRGEVFSVGVGRLMGRKRSTDITELATELEFAGDGYTTHYTRVPSL